MIQLGQPISLDHDVRSWRRDSAAAIFFHCLICFTSLSSLSCAELAEEAAHKECDAKDEPEPAEGEVPWVAEDVKEKWNCSEDTCGKDDEGSQKDSTKSPLAVAVASCKPSESHGYF
eukprot:TRINITY_DN340_c0_g2_i4.p1 TRINITY_DN340_c0_g2~~TRINITY_DN340_c0_g2_i4.p1  ORF type:complete len:117 (+),score=27.37 TRINITY_DN340_c0_g2_i4:369-719(+)